MVYKIVKQILYNTITTITNLIGTVSDGEVTTSQFPVSTNGQMATVEELYYKIIKLTNNNQI